LPEPPSNPYSYTSLAALPLVLLHRAKDSGTYEMLMDLFRKSGINAKVIMHITQPGVILDWLESGLRRRRCYRLLKWKPINLASVTWSMFSLAANILPGAGKIAVYALSARADGYYYAWLSV
jgi:hypothetical protein